MTKEEIKASISMREVLRRYSLPAPRNGFISCPFHLEDTASCYIEEKNFHCFGCGAHGDVFAFVQRMEGVSFKEAFCSLGGTYEKTFTRAQTYERNLRLAEINRLREIRESDIRACKKKLKQASQEMEVWRPYLRMFEPMTDDWCYAMEKFSRASNIYDSLFEELQELKD